MSEYLDYAFHIGPQGGIAVTTDPDKHLRHKIEQILFTSPGERVNEPEFGCGVLRLVFEPNSDILTAVTRFTITQALQRYLGREATIDAVDVRYDEEKLYIEIVYTRTDTMEQQRATFQI